MAILSRGHAQLVARAGRGSIDMSEQEVLMTFSTVDRPVKLPVQKPSIAISFEDGSVYTIHILKNARDRVRYNFNPSGLMEVNVLKAIAAAFMTECDVTQSHPDQGREFATAKTDMQSACMFAEAAATLPKPVSEIDDGQGQKDKS